MIAHRRGPLAATVATLEARDVLRAVDAAVALYRELRARVTSKLEPRSEATFAS